MDNNDTINETRKDAIDVVVHGDEDAIIQHDAELLADYLYQLFKETEVC